MMNKAAAVDWKTSFVKHFEDGCKDSGKSNLGVEVEHFIVNKVSKEAIPYKGEKGVREILTKLMDDYSEAVPLEDDDFFGFQVPEFNITLEPAAQLEISIQTSDSVSWIGEVYTQFLDNLNTILDEYGYEALHAGCQPVSKVDALELIPKKRYDLMNAYFAHEGTDAKEMMRGTASLQVSIDYKSEEDFRDKIQAAYFYGPVLKMFCDNEDTFQGEPVKGHLMRTDIWRRTDPKRCGIVKGVFREDFGFADYADFIGQMPPIFLKKGKEITSTGLKTTAEVFADKLPDEAEITHVLSMAFPDVRLKQFLELRFADCVELPLIKAYSALIKGLLYSEEGLAYAHDQIVRGKLTEEDIKAAEDALMEKGWHADVYSRPAVDLAKRMLDIAGKHLPDEERSFLTPFYDMIDL